MPADMNANLNLRPQQVCDEIQQLINDVLEKGADQILSNIRNHRAKFFAQYEDLTHSEPCARLLVTIRSAMDDHDVENANMLFASQFTLLTLVRDVLLITEHYIHRARDLALQQRDHIIQTQHKLTDSITTILSDPCCEHETSSERNEKLSQLIQVLRTATHELGNIPIHVDQVELSSQLATKLDIH